MSSKLPLDDIFTFDINRNIEGVIKADDDSHLAQEVKEFVVTKEVAQKLGRQFFDAYNETGGTNGVWISGFYGSGKSHLLKMLSVLLQNEEIEEVRTGKRFADKVRENNPLLAGQMEQAARIPAESILFNIDQKAILNSTGKDQADAVLAVFMSVFNEARGYFPRLAWLADLERRLDREGIFDKFKATFREQTGKDWNEERYQVALVRSKFAKAYGAAAGGSAEDGKAVWESARSDYRLSIESFADEVNDYVREQETKDGQTGFRLNFFVDEVGQYIGEDTKLMTNLQTIAESLYTRCDGRAWVFVTSQEDIDSVLGGLKEKQSQDFSKIQARFKCKLNLTSQNVDEVIELRLLRKNEAGKAALGPVYDQEHNNFATVLSFHEGGTNFRVADSKEEYLRKYPFQPFHFGLMQDCVRALSRQNALMGKHASVGERSLLAIFQDVVKGMAKEKVPVGHIPTFDRAFDGLQSTLKGEVQSSLNTAINNIGADSFEVRVLKILFLVKYVKNFEATPHHLTALLTASFDQDQKALEQDVQTALNKLTRESYILRNGTKYEFLTDDEKDIEQDINNTDVDAVKVNTFLASILFDEVIRDTNVIFPANKQRFSFNRRLDDGPVGRQLHELTLNVVTPRYDYHGQPATLAAHTLGKPEVLFVLDEARLLMDDVRIYQRTKTYLTQNSAGDDEKGLILHRRSKENEKRRDDIIEQAKETLARATIIVSGEVVKDIGVGEVRNRVAMAMQQLITRTYHSLGLLPRDFSFQDATETLLRPTAELLGDSGTPGPAEGELLTYVQRQAQTAQRVTAKSLFERFGGKPYGWSEGSTATILARLIAASRLEATADGRDLSNKDAADYLSSNRRTDSLIVRPLAEISGREVGRLKRFQQEVFNETSKYREAKDVAAAFQEVLRGERQEARGFLRQSNDFPFVEQLQPYLAALDKFTDLRYTELFQQLDAAEDELTDLRESTYAPIKAFIGEDGRGNLGLLYRKIGQFLKNSRENYRHLPNALITPLRDLLANEKPYLGGVMSQAKVRLDAALSAVRERQEQDRRQVSLLLNGKRAELEAMEEYADLTGVERKNLTDKLARTERRITGEQTISGLQQSMREFEDRTFGELVNQIAALSAAHRRPAPDPAPSTNYAPAAAPKHTKAEEPKPRYLPLPASRELRDQAGLKSSLIREEAELERYLDALREAGKKILERGDGIRL